MKKFFGFLWSFLEVVIIIYVICVTSFILCRNKYGFTQIGDYTFDSINLFDQENIKDTNNGDLLVVKNSNDIKNGDLIYYYAIYNEDYIVKSDVIVDVKSDDYSFLYTVGDRDGTTVSNARVLGKHARVYPKLGRILSVLESSVGFFLFVLLPIVIVFVYQMFEFIVTIRDDRRDDNIDKDKSNFKKKESNNNKNNVEEFDDIEII